jgi:hypothetical protein
VTTSPLPHPKEIKDMFTDMLGRDIAVTVCDPFTPVAGELYTSALYVDDVKSLHMVAGMDLALSAFAGAAIGLVPAGGAEGMIEDRELTPMVRDNLFEVLNIFSALFNKPETPHLKIHQMFAIGENPPADVIVLMKALGMRLDLKIEVAGYGAGRLAVVQAR